MFKELERIGKKITNNLNIKAMTIEDETMEAARVYAEGIAQHSLNKKYCEEDFIAGAMWRQTHPRWISVDEELPKDKSWIIVSTVQNSMACPAYYYEGEDIEELRSQGITHWMPMPKAPKKGGEI